MLTGLGSAETQPCRPAIEARNVYRFFRSDEDETLALRGITLQVALGEMVAIVGPSGSGKSTLLACLAGIDEPNAGEVRILGERMTRRPEAERASLRARRVGMLYQTDNLFEHLTVEQNLLLAMHLAKAVRRERLSEILKALGLNNQRRSYPSQLSGGEAARAGLAVALAPSPNLLLADEPTGEVDAETEIWILQLFTDFCREGGALVVATHSLALAKHVTRIIRLVDGKVIEDG
jgi:putative ABC transport system ATP-binding protein